MSLNEIFSFETILQFWIFFQFLKDWPTEREREKRNLEMEHFVHKLLESEMLRNEIYLPIRFAEIFRSKKQRFIFFSFYLMNIRMKWMFQWINRVHWSLKCVLTWLAAAGMKNGKHFKKLFFGKRLQLWKFHASAVFGLARKTTILPQ